MIEWIIVIVMVALALAYLARRAWRTIRARRGRATTTRTALTIGGRKPD